MLERAAPLPTAETGREVAPPEPTFLLNSVVRHSLSESTVLLACGGGLLLIFWVDWATPGDVHPEMLYALVVLGALWVRRPVVIVTLTVLTNALIVLGYLVSPLEGPYWIALVNRGFAVVLVWTVAALVYLIHKTLARLHECAGNRTGSHSEETRGLTDA